MPWLILALMGAGTFIYGLTTHATLLCLLVKPLPVLALLGWLHDAPPTDYRRWISLGLIFSLVGDVLLAWPGDLFIFGLGAFLFAHLAYLKAYFSDCGRCWRWRATFCWACCGCLVVVLKVLFWIRMTQIYRHVPLSLAVSAL